MHLYEHLDIVVRVTAEIAVTFAQFTQRIATHMKNSLIDRAMHIAL